MKQKKHENKRFDVIKHSLVTNPDSTVVKLKDTFNTYMFMDDFWLKRIYAAAIDYLILFIGTGILWPTAHFAEFVLTMGAFAVLYFTVAESYIGYTLGKKLFTLNVVNLKGTKPTLKNSLTRNISKFNPVLLILDTIIGRITSSTHQKFLDRIANTTVDISPEARLGSEKKPSTIYNT